MQSAGIFKQALSQFIFKGRLFNDAGKYAVVGGGAALTDFTVFFVLTHGAALHPLAAHMISRPLGGIFSFTGNRLWTFKNRGSAILTIQLIRYWTIWVLSYVLTSALVWLLHDMAGLPPLVSKAGAEGIAAIFNFLMQRHWTFG